MPPLNSSKAGAYDMIVLEAKARYLYSIPSFSAKLRHIYVRIEDESTGMNFYDMFFHEYPGCSILEVTHLRVMWVTNRCIVEVHVYTNMPAYNVACLYTRCLDLCS